MKIALGGDHAGFEYKADLIDKLTKKGFEVKDFGPFSADSVDYPDFVHPVSEEVEKGNYDFGVLLCGSGNGAQITANKYPNVRAALGWTKEQAELSRQHNDANILSLPGRFVSFELAWEMVQIFLNTDFEGGRHAQRVQKISKVKSN